MTDTRRGRSTIDPEQTASTPEPRNHTGKKKGIDDPSVSGPEDDSQGEGPAAWVGKSSESRLRVPANAEGLPDARAVRKPKPGDIMTRAEVAVLLRCSEPHVVALVEREQLPGFRLGRPWRFRRSEVLAWCE